MAGMGREERVAGRMTDGLFFPRGYFLLLRMFILGDGKWRDEERGAKLSGLGKRAKK